MLLLIIFCFSVKFIILATFFGHNISSDMLTEMFVNNLLVTLIFVVFSSPPLLSLFLLRRPSFWRVLLHVATAFYILWIVYNFFTYTIPPDLL